MYVLKINICTFGIFKRKHANQEGIPKKNKNEKTVRARNQDKNKLPFLCTIKCAPTYNARSIM